MKPYGIVVYSEGQGARYPARHSADGEFPFGKFDRDDIESGQGYPSVIFFEREEWRDREMDMLLQTFPGVMFCPITITTGKKTQPNPKASEFVISNRGVLPA